MSKTDLRRGSLDNQKYTGLRPRSWFQAFSMLVNIVFQNANVYVLEQKDIINLNSNHS